MNGIAQQLADTLKRSWWRVLLRGVVAIAFGLYTYFQPGIALAALVLVFGIYALVDGILAVWTAFEGRKVTEYWWVLLLGGLAGIGIGILTFMYPGTTAIVLLFYIALLAMMRGVLEIAAGIRLRREIDNEWLLILAGLASVVFGILLIASPGAGILAVLWLLATYAVIYGIILLVLAFRARSFAKKITGGAAAPAR